MHVSGELDICTAPLLALELDEAQRDGSEVLVDLEKVDFIDCAGLRTIQSAGFPGARVMVTPGPAHVQKLFELTGARRWLQIVPPRAVLAA